MKRTVALFLVAAVLTACGSPTPEPTPTHQPLMPGLPMETHPSRGAHLAGLLIGLLYVAAAIDFDRRCRKMYDELMAYMRDRHPEVAQQIGRKPLGDFLTRAYSPSVRYAREHEPLDDPEAEELLADYARFSGRGQWYAVAALLLLITFELVFY